MLRLGSCHAITKLSSSIKDKTRNHDEIVEGTPFPPLVMGAATLPPAPPLIWEALGGGSSNRECRCCMPVRRKDESVVVEILVTVITQSAAAALQIFQPLLRVTIVVVHTKDFCVMVLRLVVLAGFFVDATQPVVSQLE